MRIWVVVLLLCLPFEAEAQRKGKKKAAASVEEVKEKTREQILALEVSKTNGILKELEKNTKKIESELLRKLEQTEVELAASSQRHIDAEKNSISKGTAYELFFFLSALSAVLAWGLTRRHYRTQLNSLKMALGSNTPPNAPKVQGFPTPEQDFKNAGKPHQLY